MELPINTLIIIAIAVIVLLAVVIGIILPSRSGGNEISNRNEFTLLCNGWAAKGCAESYYYDNEEKANRILGCSDLGSCKGKCSSAGFC